MSIKILRIATRKSPLALWQANHIANILQSHWPTLQIELLPLVTSGDRFLNDTLLSVGGKGLFVKELEDALLQNRADIAVHSVKDVTAIFPPGLALTAIHTRENPLDALVSLKYPNLNELPPKAIIGTSSLRRQSQLLAIRPDLQIKSLRGNINTRLEKLKTCEFDAIILAAAGLTRMGLEHYITEELSDDTMLPACGQGALGIESRLDDDVIQLLISPLNDPQTALCVHTERLVNALLGGNCHVPLAIYCQPKKEARLTLRVKVMSSDGRIIIEDHQEGHEKDATHIAHQCVNTLIAKGAMELLAIS